MEISVDSGLVYGPSGQRLDVYRPSGPSSAYPLVLLWHGRGPDERDVLASLAAATAAQGAVCVVPDWRPDAPDEGRAHLHESAEFVQEHGADFGGDTQRITLAGWSLGGKTAVGVALDEAALGAWRPRAVVSIAGGYTTPDPLTGRAALDKLAGADGLATPVPIQLIHGTTDSIAEVEHSRRLHAALRQRNWPSALTELVADHSGIVMAEYDPDAARSRPSENPEVVRAGNRTAQLIAQAAM